MVYLSVIPAPRNFRTPFGVLDQVINLTDTQPEHERWIKLVTDALNGQISSKKVFQAELDVSGYKPEDLNVKVAEGHVYVEGKHEVKHSDENSEDYLLRQFKRKIALPENIIEDGLQCKLSVDGKKLLVTAPLKVEAPPEKKARTIPIQFESAPNVTNNGNEAPAPAAENTATAAEGSAQVETPTPATENVKASEDAINNY